LTRVKREGLKESGLKTELTRPKKDRFERKTVATRVGGPVKIGTSEYRDGSSNLRRVSKTRRRLTKRETDGS